MAGGGGGGDDYEAKQAAIEAKKDASRAALNEKFGVGDSETAQAAKAGRADIYSTVRKNAYDSGLRGLNETRDNAKRNNSFALFAQGLNGGSEDVDQNALLDRTYNQGVLSLGAKADATKADLQSADETTRLNLLQSINSGTDQASALSSAANQMNNASDKAAADASGTTLGDLFATSGALYTKSQAAQGKAAAQQWWNEWSKSNGAPSSYTGTTSRTD
jgi:hypothetical protein